MTEARGGVDEFDAIARLFRPLTFGAPEARGLLDDVAILPNRAGCELVVTQDAMVEGVHFLADDPPVTIGRKLLRVNLSDLAAKAVEPYAVFLTIAWPPRWGDAMRAAFAAGLGDDLSAFGCTLMGGDTVRTSGPLVASLTLMGWAPEGVAVERCGARPGDVLLVSGWIGDGVLGLEAARGGLASLGADAAAYLVDRYRLPQPRLGLREALRRHAVAAADVSDGLLADAGHVAAASGCGVEIALDGLPLSPAGAAWLERQSRAEAARLTLASGGDDYEVVCAARPDQVGALTAAAAREGVPLHPIGRFTDRPGVAVSYLGRPVEPGAMGWTHS